MTQPEIRIYAGKIKDWTKDVSESRKIQTICGRRLLAYGLADMGRRDVFSDTCGADEVHDFLEKRIEKGVHGKPYFREFPGLHFNISHSGDYAACALSSVPCGLDIQEIRPIRTKRLLEKVMSETEQQRIAEAKNSEWAFCRYWARKESFLKLTGEGITRSMKEIPCPAWYEMFVIREDISGCISAGEACRISYREVPAEAFWRTFRGK